MTLSVQIHNSNYPPQHQPDFSTEPAVSYVLGNEKLDLGAQKRKFGYSSLYLLSCPPAFSITRISMSYKFVLINSESGILNRTGFYPHLSTWDVAQHQTSRWKILRSVDAASSRSTRRLVDRAGSGSPTGIIWHACLLGFRLSGFAKKES